MVNSGIYSNVAEMAPATIHLRIASEIAERKGINLSGQFLLGSISPDAVYARVDIKNSHYRNEGIKKSWFIAADEFNSVENLFLKGYCIHIMSDVLWLSGIYAEQKKKHSEDFAKSFLVEDMNYLEKWLYRQKEYLSLWNGIAGTKINNINYFVSPGEVELYKSQKAQSIKYDIVAESMKYLTLEEVDKFVNKAVKRILVQLNK